MLRRTAVFIASTLVASACSPPPNNGDAGTDARSDTASDTRTDSSTLCTTDLECSDGTFCNGEERCSPSSAGANARGCVAATPAAACLTGMTCDEANDRCVSDCATAVDADGDGHRSMMCGGDDCDDSNAHRFPGNPEVCDAMNVDEDCDPTTFANATTRDGDGDNDGNIATRCCNTDRNGMRYCGTDCDDANPAVNRSAPEVCNGTDDNCNGMTDEGVERTFYPDNDGDRFGDATGTPMRGCTPPAMYVEDNLDCDDTNILVRPGLPDVCDGLNNDCRGGIDDEPEATSRCGLVPNGTVACTAGACQISMCATNRGDCDHNFANGCETDVANSPDNCGACGHSCGTGGVCTAGTCDTIVQIAAGGSHTCVRRSGGALVCWGSNRYGELGFGATGRRLVPTVATLVSDTVQVSSGANYTCAIPPSDVGGTAYGDTYCWGHNDAGQLGIGTLSDNPFPSSLGPMIFVDRLSVAAGLQHTCRWFLYGGTTASVQCWGRADIGQAGSPTVPYPGGAPSPRAITFAAGFTPSSSIDVGDFHSCVRSTTGAVACWGSRANGALGDGSTTGSSATPVLATGVANVTQIALGSRHTCALRGDGTVMCWGRSASGQLGRVTSGMISDPTPAVVPGLSGVVEISAGFDNTCARTSDGRVSCWGEGTLGGVGDGAALSRSSPTLVTGLTDATAISTGNGYTCATRAAGGVVCWGFNDEGQLGDGTQMQRNAPVAVTGL